MTAVIGSADRVPTAAHLKSYLGLAPRAWQTGNTDRKGQPMSKAGSRLARATLIRAADWARKQDPQLARVYHQQMTERGADHLKACCVVAARLAERLWAVMHRRMPYVVCDTDGTPVTPDQAKQIIAEQWTVTEDVRRRRAAATGRGRPLTKSSPDMTNKTREGPTEATFPTPILRNTLTDRQAAPGLTTDHR